MVTLTEEELQRHKKEIDELSHIQMARLWRFGPPGHIYFRSDLPLVQYFQRRFVKLGGMTPAISKAIGLMRTG